MSWGMRWPGPEVGRRAEAAGCEAFCTGEFADGNAYFNRPGPRLADSAEMLAEMIHPEMAGAKHEGTAWVRHSSPSPRSSVGKGSG